VDWSKAIEIGYSLLLSPIVGFFAAALLLLLMKAVVRQAELYRAPEGNQPPPLWIRALLILTCTGVSFAHGSRRPEGNGPDHAHPDRHGADGLCPQSRAAG
jgi:inorganic phosphate transporter, PiT family